jgi:hypothetical protein
MKQYFYFYDINETLLERYPAWISSRILEDHKNDDIGFVFLYSEKYHKKAPENLPPNTTAIYLPFLGRSSLRKLVKQYPPVSYCSIAQRVPDMRLITFFKQLGIPTFVVQHGIMVDHLKRISLIKLLFQKAFKFVKFGVYSNALARENGLSYFGSLRDIFNIYIKGKYRLPHSKVLSSDSLNADYLLNFDPSWIDYYKEQYGYREDQMIFIGNPDFVVLKDLIFREEEDAVCYICQTLVEDGRYEAEKYRRFLDDLNEATRGKKLYIKKHPRSRMALYESFKDRNDVVFTDDMPRCRYVIGHYSSVILMARQLTDNILLWELQNHEIPETFKPFAKVITSEKAKVIEFVDNNLSNADVRDNSVYLLTPSEIDALDPIGVIASSIYNKS